jgi:heme/copper-type cytochrome/quinol oxidase subunit 3
MVRRIADPSFYPYLDRFKDTNAWISICAFLLVISQLTFLFNFLYSLFKGKKAQANPYQANSLEWSTPSPPPHGNWEGALPSVSQGPYEYSLPGASEDWSPQASFAASFSHEDENKVSRKKHQQAWRFAGLLFLSSESMILAGFISALLVFKSGLASWPPIGQPSPDRFLTFAATLSILWAAIGWTLAIRSSHPDRQKIFFSGAFLGALAFLIFQGIEVATLGHDGLSLHSSLYGALLYTLLGVHGIHAVAGLLLMAPFLVMVWRGKSLSRLGLDLVSYYWYWLTAFWLVFYGLIYW